MSNARFMGLIVFGVAFIVIGLAAFTVNEREVAIKLRVGEVVASDYEPGLHWKIPVYENVRKFPSRNPANRRRATAGIHAGKNGDGSRLFR